MLSTYHACVANAEVTFHVAISCIVQFDGFRAGGTQFSATAEFIPDTVLRDGGVITTVVSPFQYASFTNLYDLVNLTVKVVDSEVLPNITVVLLDNFGYDLHT